MYSFFVLGIIPGTNTQITFQDWLGLLIILAGLYLLRRAHKHHAKTAHFIVLKQIFAPYTLAIKWLVMPLVIPVMRLVYVMAEYVCVKLLLVYSRVLVPKFSESFSRLQSE